MARQCFSIICSLLLFTSCVDDTINVLTEENKERILSSGLSRTWLETDSAGFLTFEDNSSSGKRYTKGRTSGGMNFIDEVGDWALAEGLSGALDTIMVSRDTAFIAEDTIMVVSERLLSFLPNNKIITDTAIIYRDTVLAVSPDLTVRDSLFTDGIDTVRIVDDLNNEVIDTLFAVIDTIRLIEEMDDVPAKFPSDRDTLLVILDTSATFIYDPRLVEQNWLIEKITLEALELRLTQGTDDITETYFSSQ